MGWVANQVDPHYHCPEACLESLMERLPHEFIGLIPNLGENKTDLYQILEGGKLIFSDADKFLRRFKG
jgi:hypothetical protein